MRIKSAPEGLPGVVCPGGVALLLPVVMTLLARAGAAWSRMRGAVAARALRPVPPGQETCKALLKNAGACNQSELNVIFTISRQDVVRNG